jgi:hypothetical protein
MASRDFPRPPGLAELETRTYSVSALLDLMRRGKLRIPRFQRGFRWDDEDRRQLFDSLQAGYPVGTLLLARGAASAGPIALGGYARQAPEAADALWVVDGQQRLATLAMALLEEQSGAYRPIFFDLARAQFVLGVRRRTPAPTWLPSHVLASSSQLNRWLREHAIEEDLSDQADQIAQRIREYTLPAYLVPYDGQDDSLLRQIFARVNRRGHALESHEVFEALHATADGSPLSRVRQTLALLGFGDIEETDIERAALALLGGSPRGRDELNERIEKHAAEGQPIDVEDLFLRVQEGLRRAISFLVEDAGVPHIAFLPYIGALHALARFFALHPSPHPRNRELLVRWLYRGFLSKDHRLDNAVDGRKWNAIDGDEHKSVQRLLKLLPPVDPNRLEEGLHLFKMNKSATSKMDLLALAALRPRHLLGEERGLKVTIPALLVDPEGFPLQLCEPPAGGLRTIALYALHPRASLDEIRAALPPPELLASHAITPPAFAALGAGDCAAFLRLRTETLQTHLRTFLQERAALAAPDRDRPPLEAYFMEDAA